ncbi:MAG: hypothetical protein RTU63_14390 [Candidatus Thorarchaeota archaeon]
MIQLKGSIKAKDIVKNPEIISQLQQRSIIIHARSQDEVGVAINIFLERQWTVAQCWASSSNEHNALLMKG